MLGAILMCGITGFWTSKVGIELRETAGEMARAIRHRGPDDSGEWTDIKAGLAVAHRRLSILDLSPQGHQPMLSPSGRYVIVFNGEVYNYEELRKELPRQAWKGHSDTEVMLAAFEHWGIERSLHRFIGMFAFAVWDQEERKLYLVRDRLGIKPLYYGWVHGTFLFGSELKALRAHPCFQAQIDRGSLALLMRHNYIPHPYSIYEGVKKLPPGTLLKVVSPEQIAEPSAFWSAREIAEFGSRNPLALDPQAAMEQLEELLRDAIRLRMLADVPLGAFLSGGVDSSTVVALMQSLSARPVRTFSIGFEESGYNEAPYAAAVANHLGTHHTELYLSPADAQAVIPQLPCFYDEPFSDSSQIPTYLVSRLARQSVTVALSGDGGDELFAGYPRYELAAKMSSLKMIPQFARRGAASVLRFLSAETWNKLFRHAAPLIPKKLFARRPGEQMDRLAALLRADSSEQVYLSFLSHWDSPAELVPGSIEHGTALTDPQRQALLSEPIPRMMFLDLVSYLPDDILTKVDRASMAVSLEARVPILDHRVVEFAWKLPMSLRVRNRKEKWLLRQLLYKFVPPSLIERPKMGFGIPIGAWLRGALRDWAEELLNPVRVKQEGFFDPGLVRRVWNEHVSGERNWQYHLWDVLMFQAWLAESHRQEEIRIYAAPH
jgi:asparagine synthase (glutamine-hydrolysing)